MTPYVHLSKVLNIFSTCCFFVRCCCCRWCLWAEEVVNDYCLSVFFFCVGTTTAYHTYSSRNGFFFRKGTCRICRIRV
ncbi:hypothetical protein C8F04DRAFT_483753 [Mycena alexandri]|uniref:Uncharacterized protein n=1 Tax=Mycena alexandri TaxID=1745969 RepID=A0AAD6SYT0_9AGAR|nr:hypothetical protein C8F04DRAFT_483753 [Mycena alexandri]